MTNMTRITNTIKKARQKGKSFYAIAREMGIDQAEINRLMKGKYPGEKVAQRLGLPVVCHTCKRRVPSHQSATTRQPAPKIGQPGWLAYWLKEPIKEMGQ